MGDDNFFSCKEAKEELLISISLEENLPGEKLCL